MLVTHANIKLYTSLGSLEIGALLFAFWVNLRAGGFQKYFIARFVLWTDEKEPFVVHTLFNVRVEMVSSSMDRYYDINRKFLTILGLWPYQEWKFRIIKVTLILGLLFSFASVQVYISRSFGDRNFDFTVRQTGATRGVTVRALGIHGLKKWWNPVLSILSTADSECS